MFPRSGVQRDVVIRRANPVDGGEVNGLDRLQHVVERMDPERAQRVLIECRHEDDRGQPRHVECL